jgi:hypothetical protein
MMGFQQFHISKMAENYLMFAPNLVQLDEAL